MEDVHESWSMKLARAFNADAHVQCLSKMVLTKMASVLCGIGLSSHLDYNMTSILKSPNSFLWGDFVLLRLNTKY